MFERKPLFGVGAAFSVLIVVLGLSLASVSAWSSQGVLALFGINTTLAESGSGSDGDEDEGDDEDEDEDENDDNSSGKDNDDDEDDRDDDEEDRQEEATKRTREATKRQAELLKKQSDSEDDDSDDSEEDDSDEFEDDDEFDDDDEEAMYKDKAKTLARLERDLARAKADVARRAADKGYDASAILAKLNALSVAEVAAAFDAKNFSLAKELAKKLKREIKMLEGKELHDVEDMSKDVAKVEKRINQIKKKLVELTALGGNANAFAPALAEIEADFATTKAAILAGGDGLLASLAELERIERRAKILKDTIESAIFALGGGDDDDEFEDEHEDDISDVLDEIEDIADTDNDSTSRSIKTLTRSHLDEAKMTAEKIQALKARNALAKLLLGVDDSKVMDLRATIAVNQNRIAALQALVAQVEDPTLRTLLTEQVGALQSENNALQALVSAAADENGLFGWFFRLFPVS